MIAIRMCDENVISTFINLQKMNKNITRSRYIMFLETWTSFKNEKLMSKLIIVVASNIISMSV